MAKDKALVCNFDGKKLRWSFNTGNMTLYSKGEKPKLFVKGTPDWWSWRRFWVEEAAQKEKILGPKLEYYTKSGKNYFYYNPRLNVFYRKDRVSGKRSFLDITTRFSKYYLGVVLSKGKPLAQVK